MRFKTTVNEIIRTNDIETPNQLVVGQTIVIPIRGQFYEVKQNDTLYQIGRRFQISVEELARVNRFGLKQYFLFDSCSIFHKDRKET